MLYCVVEDFFSRVWGRKPLVINDYDGMLQIKFNLKSIEARKFYCGLYKLRKMYVYSGYSVRVLLIPNGIIQIILGLPDEVNKLHLEKIESDFVLPIC